MRDPRSLFPPRLLQGFCEGTLVVDGVVPVWGATFAPLIFPILNHVHLMAPLRTGDAG